jgi:hypothetical protein
MDMNKNTTGQLKVITRNDIRKMSFAGAQLFIYTG